MAQNSGIIGNVVNLTCTVAETRKPWNSQPPTGRRVHHQQRDNRGGQRHGRPRDPGLFGRPEPVQAAGGRLRAAARHRAGEPGAEPRGRLRGAHLALPVRPVSTACARFLCIWVCVWGGAACVRARRVMGSSVWFGGWPGCGGLGRKARELQGARARVLGFHDRTRSGGAGGSEIWRGGQDEASDCHDTPPRGVQRWCCVALEPADQGRPEGKRNPISKEWGQVAVANFHRLIDTGYPIAHPRVL